MKIKPRKLSQTERDVEVWTRWYEMYQLLKKQKKLVLKSRMK
jgi:hypothetical protein